MNVEGFYCLVRGTGNLSFNLSWFFTSDTLKQFLHVIVQHSFDTHKIAMCAEGYFTAGGDAASAFSNHLLHSH